MPHAFQTLNAFHAEVLTVVQGANLGDAVGLSDDLQLDDVYQLHTDTIAGHLIIETRADDTLCVAANSGLGTPGHALHLDNCLTFMGHGGRIFECLIAVEVDPECHVDAIWLIPLHPMQANQDYRLIGMDQPSARPKLAQIYCNSFTRGTRITLAGGAQKAVEDLHVGDQVLTRDSGVQPLRWIGMSTQRAEGAFAPVMIPAGVLNNLGDLRISPEHRLFIYQHKDLLGAGRAEVMIRARHLVDNDQITQVKGGNIDYFQLLFDDHQIVFAEGIAAETLIVNEYTRPALPPDAADNTDGTLRGRDTGLHALYSLSEETAEHADAIALLRQATQRPEVKS